ncbi:MAG TPA: hypothetical protein VFO45_00990 [Sphingomicrobium sp.]|nr:hypothetical protein [Sphingomicrobium sp.]
MLVALLSVMLFASQTTATTPSSAPSTNETSGAAETSDPDKKICKRQPVTGQLQGTKRVCMTAEQWKRAQEATQRTRR